MSFLNIFLIRQPVSQYLMRHIPHKGFVVFNLLVDISTSFLSYSYTSKTQQPSYPSLIINPYFFKEKVSLVPLCRFLE